MKVIGIYKIVSPSGRVYIGESVNIYKRWIVYRGLHCKRQTKLYSSFLKYGTDEHIFDIIEECSVEDLKCRERHWQDFYNVLNGGLNLKLTECGDKKYVPSQETIEKLKVANAGENNPNFGKSCSEVQKSKISKTMIERGINKGESNPSWGKTKSEEAKRSIGEANKKNNLYGDCHTAKRVLDTTTGIIHSCIKEVSDLFGLNYNNLRNALNGKTKNKTIFKIYIENEL